jgi:phosphoribosylglycinamide formyltransferase 1
MALPLLVLASGRGSNLSAILRAIDGGTCDAEVVGVVSDRAAAPALEVARARGIATAVVSPRQYENRQAWDMALAGVARSFEVRVVVLAGFMRIVGQPLLDAFPHAILNVHPALLPAFPGSDGPAQAIAKGVRISGCTVHLVDSGVDTGPIVAQAAVPVLPADDAESLHARIQAQEHVLLPWVIDAIARGALTLGPTPQFSARCAFDAAALVVPHTTSAG